MKSIRILITGGTFDKEYDEIKGQLDFGETHIPEMLKLGRCNIPIEVRTLMMIDSLAMTDTDRELIYHTSKNSPEDALVITHGTDTMSDTARYLGERELNKTIILTGAMIPYKFGSSDGFFNLGSSLAFAQCLDAGVYVAMNGRYYSWQNVRKNKSTGFFEELRPED